MACCVCLNNTNSNVLGMALSKDRYKSELSKAIGSGSVRAGAHHWWYQRFTAVILVLVSWWVMSFFRQLIAIGNGAGQDMMTRMSEVVFVLQNPYNILILIIFACSSLYHGMLGMQVVIEDYVNCYWKRIICLILLKIFTIVTIVALFLSIVYVMTL